jgi:hypothetical protein
MYSIVPGVVPVWGMGFVVAASTGHEAGEGGEKNLYIPLTDSYDRAAKLTAVSQGFW